MPRSAQKKKYFFLHGDDGRLLAAMLKFNAQKVENLKLKENAVKAAEATAGVLSRIR